MPIFDTHSHYDDEAFDADREELFSAFPSSGVETVINVAASLNGVRNTLEYIKKYDFIYGAVGVHPDEVGELNEESFAFLADAAQQDKVIAIGEIGLDYYWDKEARDLQKYWFERQIDLAVSCKLPVIIHSREAAADTFDVVSRACREKSMQGVMHCYSYSPEQAALYTDMGLYLGIGGVVTFKNAKKLVETVRQTPLSRLLLETDCPYLAPEPLRGSRNSSLNLVLVVKKIAEIKDVSEEEVLSATYSNALQLFGIR